MFGAAFFFLCFWEYQDDYQSFYQSKQHRPVMEKELNSRQEKRILLLIKMLDAKTLEICCFFT